VTANRNVVSTAKCSAAFMFGIEIGYQSFPNIKKRSCFPSCQTFIPLKYEETL